MTDILSLDETRALADHEAAIQRGLKTFVEVGNALYAIRDERLYRSTFGTFEDYCRERWGFNDRRASQLIAAAETVSTIVETGLPSPANEGQARELSRVPEPKRAEVWRETLERTEGKPTASAVRETYAAIRPTSTATPPPAPAPAPTPNLFAGDDWAEPDDEPEQVSPVQAQVADFVPTEVVRPTVMQPAPVTPITPTAIIPAQPAAVDYARLDAELDAEMENTDARFRRNFMAAMAKADDVWQFDTNRIAELYAATYDTDIRPWIEEMTRWCERVQRACEQRSTGLRLV